MSQVSQFLWKPHEEKKEARVVAKKKEEEDLAEIIIICVRHRQEEGEGPSRELLPEAKEGTLPLFLPGFFSVPLVG
ncbi:uncharacterized protein DS421_15g493180 [Arachis hypogaea]|nr:uncharacterized protein DS421_15g493180 [Arachis hypogaea]